MSEYSVAITEDEALVLFEFFHRFEETEKLELAHSSEYVALMKVAGQLDKTTSAMFSPEYVTLLEDARRRIANGFNGSVPGMRSGT